MNIVDFVRLGKLDRVASYLHEGGDVLAVDPDEGLPLLMLACQHGQEEVLALLIRHSASVDEVCAQTTAIEAAICFGHASCVTLLLDAKASPNAFATRTGGQPPLFTATAMGELDCTRALLKGRADPNFKMPTEGGVGTPLMTAIFSIVDRPGVRGGDASASEEMVRLLLAAQADPTVAGPDGFTPAMIALKIGPRTKRIVLLLKEYEIMVQKRNQREAQKDVKLREQVAKGVVKGSRFTQGGLNGHELGDGWGEPENASELKPCWSSNPGLLASPCPLLTSPILEPLHG